MRGFKQIVLMFLFPFCLCATDLKPWFPRDFEVQAGATELLQYYKHVRGRCRDYHNHTLDSFTTLSLEFAYYDYCAEVETTFAHTKRQSFGCDNIRLTGRYQLLNDCCGDLVSAAVGLTVTQAFQNSLRDPSSFHHGIIEGELHFSAGMETISLDRWLSRFWGVLGVACGDHGWPWIHGQLTWERNWCDQQQLKLFLDTLWGFGHKEFRRPFRGYGNIRHQSIDLGVGYSYIFETEAKLSCSFAYRVYARNFPSNASLLKLEFVYPFSL